MQIAIENPDQPDVIQLIDDLDAYQKPLYPPESHYGIDIAALSAANVLFAVARDEAGTAIGCGAIVMEPGYGELKRMYVRPENRGQGVAAKVLAFLEARGDDAGLCDVQAGDGREPARGAVVLCALGLRAARTLRAVSGRSAECFHAEGRGLRPPCPGAACAYKRCCKT
jgi:GNAT superfamily N-acetyltransferase